MTDVVTMAELCDGVSELHVHHKEKKTDPLGRKLARRGSFIDYIPRRAYGFSELKIAEAQQTYGDIGDVLFGLLQDKNTGLVPVSKFWSSVKSTGIWPSIHKLKETKEAFGKLKQPGSDKRDVSVDKDTFKSAIQKNINMISKIFKNDMIIPEFQGFCRKIDELYLRCRENNSGKPAQYIPQLANQDPSMWGVALCTVDGQRYGVGDTKVPFCLQSCSKPLNYAQAVSDLGGDEFHKYVGQEPSGRSFNELVLNPNNKPHNPMINSGAIVTVSLLKSNLTLADRFDYITSQYKEMAGGEHIGFQNSTYLSERESADRNFALGFLMREYNCYPENTDLMKTLELYFQLCSVEVTLDVASLIAGTLANGGVCPTTGRQVLSPVAVRNTLSLMYSCGMYDYSGQFAFKVGLPSKSGVSGLILLVIPGLMGMAIWSPPLDKYGNSARGVQFCEELVNTFNFHNYDNLVNNTTKLDPRKRSVENRHVGYALSDVDMASADYDKRTALHLAAAEGHLDICKFLIEQCHVAFDPKDRWGFTPLDDAKRFGHKNCEEYLRGRVQQETRTHYELDFS